MQNQIDKMYLCVFPYEDSYYDTEVPSYTDAINYAEQLGIPCFVYSPNQEIISAYIEKQWVTIH